QIFFLPIQKPLNTHQKSFESSGLEPRYFMVMMVLNSRRGKWSPKRTFFFGFFLFGTQICTDGRRRARPLSLF
ncbi:MAG: hypothetical protein ABI233_10550, partial [Chthoniobacterales bacterium]